MYRENRWPLYSWGAGFTGLILFLVLGVNPAFGQAQRKSVPQEVARYISVHNMAAAFSTPEERLQLTQYDTPEAVRDSTNSQRLADVFIQMQTEDALEMEVDPGMPMGDGSSRVERIQPQLLEIDRVSQDGNGHYVVEIVAHRIDPEANMQFISTYEDDREVSIPKDVTVHLQRQTQYWVDVNGTWKKQETELLYLEGG